MAFLSVALRPRVYRVKLMSQSPQSGQWHSYEFLNWLVDECALESQSPQSGQWHSYPRRWYRPQWPMCYLCLNPLNRVNGILILENVGSAARAAQPESQSPQSGQWHSYIDGFLLDFSPLDNEGSQSPQSGQWHSYIDGFLLDFSPLDNEGSQSPQSGQWHSYSAVSNLLKEKNLSSPKYP